MRQGFWKVAAAAPVLRVADCAGNAERIGEEMTRAFKAGVGSWYCRSFVLRGVRRGPAGRPPAPPRGAEAGLAALLEYSRNKEMLTLAGSLAWPRMAGCITAPPWCIAGNCWERRQ